MILVQEVKLEVLCFSEKTVMQRNFPSRHRNSEHYILSVISTHNVCVLYSFFSLMSESGKIHLVSNIIIIILAIFQ